MTEKLVIFDFDGVLVDSFNAWHKISNRLFEEVLGKRLSERQYKDFFMAEINKGFRRFAGSEENYQKLKRFSKGHSKEFFLKYYSKVKLFPFIQSLLLWVNKAGAKSVIISSSTHPNFVTEILKRAKLKDSFVVSLSSEGESKVGHLKKVLEEFSFKSGDTFFITDTYNDIKWGKEAGVNTIAVLWGFHNKKTLEKAKPDFIVKNYKELYEII